MIERTIWISDDGVEFDTKDECMNYEENVLAPLNKILSNLRPANSYGVRQDGNKVKKAFKEFMSLCGKVIPEGKKVFDKISEDKAHISHAEWILSDYSNNYPSLNETMYRFHCISKKTWIEYPQLYFAKNEKEWKDKII